jgi:pimeloyl-ACP methyl ester carboxylesterase
MSQVGEPTQKEITANEMYQLWFTVPKREPTERERRIIAQTENFSVPYQEIEIPISRWGQGPVVLLVHGWGGDRGQLTGFVAPLVEAGYQVISFDAPAHGEAPGTQTTGFEFAGAMRAVTDSVGAPHAIIAHSFGTLGTSIALTNGLTAEKLIFSGAMRRLSDAFEIFVREMDISPEIAAIMKTRLEKEYGQDVWERTAVDKLVTDIPLPALMFHDKKDPVTPYLSSAAIARVWPSATLVTTEGLGHRRILWNESVIQQVVDFISHS